MKLVFQAIIGSIIIHGLFIVSMFIVAYIKTNAYQPDFSSEWGQVQILQNEVAFGTIISPLLLLSSFVGVTVVCGIIVVSYRKLFTNVQKETLS